MVRVILVRGRASASGRGDDRVHWNRRRMALTGFLFCKVRERGKRPYDPDTIFDQDNATEHAAAVAERLPSLLFPVVCHPISVGD